MLICLFLSGCASSSPFKKVDDSSKQYSLPGFSIKAPSGKGWFLSKNDGKRVIFFRRYDDRTKSLIAMAVLHQLPEIKPDTEAEFLKMVSAIRRRNKNSRFETIIKEEALSNEKSTFTVRYKTKYKDFGAKSMPKDAKYMITEDIGILWRHPENKNIGLTIGLSQRHLKNEPIKAFKEIAEEFIRNVHIEPL